MASAPKLEVFKIRLVTDQKPTFKELFYTDPNQTANQIMLDMLGKFLKKLDNKKFHRNDKTKKAMTSRAGDGAYKSIEPDLKNQAIYGLIDGGPYGRNRRKSEVDNKTVQDPVNKNNVITDEFFFFLHTPLLSDTAILMVQSYSGDSITNLFLSFVCDFFKSSTRKFKRAKKERFIPEAIKKDFREKGVIKKFRFSTDFVVGHLAEHDIEVDKEEFIVTIEATSKREIERGSLIKYLNLFSKSKVMIGKNEKELKDFTKAGKATMKNTETNKTSPFSLTSNFDVKPAIYLDEKIKVNDGVPDWEELKKYCLSILEEIKKEAYPINQVNEVKKISA